MNISALLRVFICCLVFAYFVLMPFQSRFRYSRIKTYSLITLLIVITMVVVALFLIPEKNLADYHLWAIIFWISSAVVIFNIIFKGSFLELLFLVLVVLNLYVNIVAVAKVIVNGLERSFSDGFLGVFATAGVLLLYLPLLWLLLHRLYRKIIELHIDMSLWRFIWVIPALTYTIFYVKIVKDYWCPSPQSDRADMVFIILWSFTTYVLFFITLQLLLLTYEGVIANEEIKLVESQLRMQEGQYKKLLENIENTARNRHDWKHHLLTISGFADAGELESLKDYLGGLMPIYVTDTERTVCRNHVVDVILLHYISLTREREGTIDIKADIPNDIPVLETDLCIIFGNLVENASEAALSCDENSKIEVKAYTKGSQLIIKVSNTYRGQILQRDGVYYSTKHEGAGIGIASVRRVVEKYGGSMKIAYDNTYFTVFVLLNYKNDV